MNDCDDAILAGGGENVHGAGVEDDSIGTVADGESGDLFAVVGVENGHDFIAADGEDATIFGVEGEAGGAVAAIEWPGIEDAERCAAETNESILVFEIYPDAAFAVGGGEFGLGTEGQGGENSEAFDGDDGGVFTAGVKSDDDVGGGFELNGIRVGTDFDFFTDCEGFEVKGGDGVFATVGSKAETGFGCDGDAVDAGSIGDFTDDFAVVGIEDDGFVRVGDVEAVGVGVECSVVPTAFAADGPMGGDFVAGGCK